MLAEVFEQKAQNADKALASSGESGIMDIEKDFIQFMLLCVKQWEAQRIQGVPT